MQTSWMIIMRTAMLNRNHDKNGGLIVGEYLKKQGPTSSGARTY